MPGRHAKGKDDASSPQLSGPLQDSSNQGLVTAVNAVKSSESYDRAAHWK